jgi:hypothetical protein
MRLGAQIVNEQLALVRAHCGGAEWVTEKWFARQVSRQLLHLYERVRRDEPQLTGRALYEQIVIRRSDIDGTVAARVLRRAEKSFCERSHARVEVSPVRRARQQPRPYAAAPECDPLIERNVQARKQPPALVSCRVTSIFRSVPCARLNVS